MNTPPCPKTPLQATVTAFQAVPNISQFNPSPKQYAPHEAYSFKHNLAGNVASPQQTWQQQQQTMLPIIQHIDSLAFNNSERLASQLQQQNRENYANQARQNNFYTPSPKIMQKTGSASLLTKTDRSVGNTLPPTNQDSGKLLRSSSQLVHSNSKRTLQPLSLNEQLNSTSRSPSPISNVFCSTAAAVSNNSSGKEGGLYMPISCTQNGAAQSSLRTSTSGVVAQQTRSTSNNVRRSQDEKRIVEQLKQKVEILICNNQKLTETLMHTSQKLQESRRTNEQLNERVTQVQNSLDEVRRTHVSKQSYLELKAHIAQLFEENQELKEQRRQADAIKTSLEIDFQKMNLSSCNDLSFMQRELFALREENERLKRVASKSSAAQTAGHNTNNQSFAGGTTSNNNNNNNNNNNILPPNNQQQEPITNFENINFQSASTNNEQLNAQISTQQDNLRKLRQENTQLQQQMEQLIKENIELTDYCDRTLQENKSLQKRIVVAAAAPQPQQIQQQNDQLTAEFLQKVQECKEQQRLYKKQMETRIEEIKQQYEKIIEDLQRRLATVHQNDSAADNKVRVQNDILKKEVEEKNVELDVWRAKYAKLKQEITELKSQFREYEKIMTHFRQRRAPPGGN